MLGHGAGIGYMGPGPRMGHTDNFSLVMGSARAIFRDALLRCNWLTRYADAFAATIIGR